MVQRYIPGNFVWFISHVHLIYKYYLTVYFNVSLHAFWTRSHLNENKILWYKMGQATGFIVNLKSCCLYNWENWIECWAVFSIPQVPFTVCCQVISLFQPTKRNYYRNIFQNCIMNSFFFKFKTKVKDSETVANFAFWHCL